MRSPPITGACAISPPPAECAAVVKADAYGLGMALAAPALARAGCKTFFVATLGEARALRALLPDPVIYVLAGLMPATAEIYRALRSSPGAEQRR